MDLIGLHNSQVVLLPTRHKLFQREGNRFEKILNKNQRILSLVRFMFYFLFKKSETES